MSNVMFWLVTPCDPVGGYQHSSVTPVTTYKATHHHNPEDHDQHLHRRENLGSQILINKEKSVNSQRQLLLWVKLPLTFSSSAKCLQSVSLFSFGSQNTVIISRNIKRQIFMPET
jgi:hypothetical protein